MSDFNSSSYAPPGVYTSVTLNGGGTVLNGTARIPVFIGEGLQVFTRTNEEVHRGSSASSDDQIVGENLSAQVTTTTNRLQLSHYPVVSGNGTGTVTTDPTKVAITVDGFNVVVVALNGTTGQVTLQSLVTPGQNVTANYYFKRNDTLISNEDLSYQVPTYASLTPQSGFPLSVSIPGFVGNSVTMAFTEAASGSGVSDLLAVSGAGTNAISIELRNTDNSIRTLGQIQQLIVAGIYTQNSGFIGVGFVPSPSTAGVAFPATQFAGGSGPNTNTVFKTKHVPIVDGTNGGVVTTDPSKVTLTVNGAVIACSAVNGATGFFTSSSPIPEGASAQVTYYTNTYQNTSDILPDASVSSISKVGYGPNRSDFVEGVDYVLVGNTISWGAAVSTTAGTSTVGYTPFDASVINTTLVDEQVYLRPVSGAVNGINNIFTLPDTPVDGSGLGRATDIPTLVSMFVGTDPVTAITNGAVRVANLSGDSATVTLYNPPSSGQKVFASYWRSLLNDHVFTLTVTEAGIPGQGTYTIQDELNRIAPSVTNGSNTVANANFVDTGIVFPDNNSDLYAPFGSADETITLTFQDDSLTEITTPATQASCVLATGGNQKIVLTASTPGTAGNSVSITLVGGGAGAADSSAITGEGTNALTVNIVEADGSTTRTWAEVLALFSTYPAAATTTAGGVIIATAASGADLTGQAVASSSANFTAGFAAVSSSYADRYVVTSSRTTQQAQIDGKGRTGNATTGTSQVGASGYLGQTYVDANTAVKFTVVDPLQALNYGYTQLPSPTYLFMPGDTLQFVVSSEAGFVNGSGITRQLPGLATQVVTTYGMNPGDTALISTFNRAGKEPGVGDYYYVSYTVPKAASDYATQSFTSVEAAYLVYGQPSLTNRLSLALKLFKANGGGQFAVVQVPTQPNGTTGSDSDFITAIQTLTKRIPGTQKTANVFIPLSTSATVQQALGVFLTQQAAPRIKAEAITFIGFNQNATPATAIATAIAIGNERVVANTMFQAGVMLQPDNASAALEYPVTGEFVAAAMAGLALSSNIDVATTLDGKNLVGFSRGLTVFDAPTMDQMAAAGLTVVEDNVGSLSIREYLTTNNSNILTNRPYVTTISDQLSQDFRSFLKQFVGQKEATGLAGSILAACNSYLKAQVNVTITSYQPVVVAQNPNDPTEYDVTVAYVPMFSLRTIVVNFTVNVS